MELHPPSPAECGCADAKPHKCLVEFVLHYVGLFGLHKGNWEPESVEELERCFRMVRENKDQVTVSELETMMRSARTWQLFEHFSRDSLDLIPNLMQLLKAHCKDNWLFHHYYGLLCFQLLTNVMLAGVINCSSEPENAFNEIRKRSRGSLDIARHVAAYSAMMALGLHPPIRHHEDRFSSSFLAEGQRGEYVILPGLGGFLEEDALWLLNALWEIRDTFCVFGNAISVMMPGWAVLFTIMWYCVKRMGSTTSLMKLRNLLLRYALTAFEPEFQLVVDLISDIEEYIPSTTRRDEELPPVNTQDVELMIRMFKNRLDSEKQGRSQKNVLYSPFAMIYHNAFTTVPDRVPPLLAAVVECVWKTLGKAGPVPALRERILEAFDYAVNSILSMCSVLAQGEYLKNLKSKHTAVIVWTKFLQDVNMIELIGRLCSISVVSSGNGLLISHEAFGLLVKSTSSFRNSLEGVAQIHELCDLNDPRHTWDKVLRYMDLQLSIYPLGSLIHHRICACRSIWFNIGAVFQFKQVAYQQHRCMNSRCSDPLPDGGAQYVCMRCYWVHYCSRRCQSIHWGSTCVGAHHEECIDLKVPGPKH
ncbi:unnamed protein product [Rhizoctonia solani]|uniref:MYND-type domain-containing protein n=1 Tax=Rhizoctonia solani TaxID=456999 RepID=A0A8H3HWQ2_9AGAM|nr:unnamed protein product [Rhizoctonia solani]